jgi:hypothetical protein
MRAYRKRKRLQQLNLIAFEVTDLIDQALGFKSLG